MIGGSVQETKVDLVKISKLKSFFPNLSLQPQNKDFLNNIKQQSDKEKIEDLSKTTLTLKEYIAQILVFDNLPPKLQKIKKSKIESTHFIEKEKMEKKRT